jgi:hypothetical protein
MSRWQSRSLLQPQPGTTLGGTRRRSCRFEMRTGTNQLEVKERLGWAGELAEESRAVLLESLVFLPRGPEESGR